MRVAHFAWLARGAAGRMPWSTGGRLLEPMNEATGAY
jgi:hypothetical protein